MNETKYTPGPWRADWDDNGQWYVEPLGITGTALRGDSGDCVESANARLIAAAPELLEALKEAEFVMNHFGDFLNGEDIVAEVQKVTGVPNRRIDKAFEMVRAAIAKAEGE